MPISVGILSIMLGGMVERRKERVCWVIYVWKGRNGRIRTEGKRQTK
jgi:hypothetical protein